MSFVGNLDVQHVASKRPFAGIASAASGMNAEAIHETMVQAGLSSKNGSTNPDKIGRIKLQRPQGGSVLFAPLELSHGSQPEDVLKQIKEEFVAGRAVAVAHKLSLRTLARKRHWTLLTGAHEQDGNQDIIHAIDPARETANYLSTHVVRTMIERASDESGVHVYALSAEPIKPLSVVYAFDQEPEPIEDTYNATGQNKAIPLA